MSVFSCLAAHLVYGAEVIRGVSTQDLRYKVGAIRLLIMEFSFSQMKLFPLDSGIAAAHVTRQRSWCVKFIAFLLQSPTLCWQGPKPVVYCSR